MPESILQTDVFYTSKNYPSKKHEIYQQTSATEIIREEMHWFQNYI